MSLEEFAKKLETFKNGFEAITKNLNSRLDTINNQIDSLIKNTEVIPQIKKENDEIFKKLNKISGVLAELTYRLDKISD
ncbi:MAG: hypothetical protein ACTSRZ_04495 [Promethearchaeota archaeon]